MIPDRKLNDPYRNSTIREFARTISAGGSSGRQAPREVIVKDRQDVLLLADRIRAALQVTHVTEKRMFGGITFLLNGNMLCCASKQGLMVRVGKDGEAAALAQPLARPCLGTGRRMGGFVMVEPDGVAETTALTRWLDVALAYVSRLPPKISTG
jgi:TfoX N-terminal domain